MVKFPSEGLSTLYSSVSKYQKEFPSLRIGQILFNQLSLNKKYKPLMEKVCGTEDDFFYVTDEKIVWSMFMDKCVK